MLRRLHPLAGAVAFMTILAFWIATVASELGGSWQTIALVKRGIVWGLVVLVPAIALTGISGFLMAGKSTAPILLSKKRRMPLIGINGLVVLVPAAITLAILAARGDFGRTFMIVQGIELVAGAINLALMALNIRDGRRLAAAIRRRRAA
ncbi:MAG: hypothetical protein EPO23_01140 [Xanthobacteraceae bacterium]|nr:MAG: hypothetical protein EPO23_01140 [Xanthobacteraceae bacterium]